MILLFSMSQPSQEAMFSLSEASHRRLNPLTGEWVLVSPHRTQRPWLGQVEPSSAESQPNYDPSCYLCPGNERAHGAHNAKYDSTFVFDNDFPALLPNASDLSINEKDLIVAQSESGICRVVCFSPRHAETAQRLTNRLSCCGNACIHAACAARRDGGCRH